MATAAETEQSPAKSPRRGSKAPWGNNEAPASPTKDPPTKEPNGTKQDTSVQKMFQSTLISCSTWDIYSPPPSNSFSGKVVPRVLNRHKNRRKLSLEVHKVTPASPETDSEDKKSKKSTPAFSYEECVLRYALLYIFDLNRCSPLLEIVPHIDLKFSMVPCMWHIL